jgi:hypothetical protein
MLHTSTDMTATFAWNCAPFQGAKVTRCTTEIVWLGGRCSKEEAELHVLSLDCTFRRNEQNGGDRQGSGRHSPTQGKQVRSGKPPCTGKARTVSWIGKKRWGHRFNGSQVMRQIAKADDVY